jgi:hypothetical protein
MGSVWQDKGKHCQNYNSAFGGASPAKGRQRLMNQTVRSSDRVRPIGKRQELRLQTGLL